MSFDFNIHPEAITVFTITDTSSSISLSFLVPFVISDSFSLYSHFLSDLNQLYGLIWLYYFSPELQICITTSKSKTDFMINCPPPSTNQFCLKISPSLIMTNIYFHHLCIKSFYYSNFMFWLYAGKYRNDFKFFAKRHITPYIILL